MESYRRLFSTLTLGFGLLASGLAPTRATAGLDEETAVLEALNDARVNAGLRPLQLHLDLEDDAERHARRMAAERRLSQVPDLRNVTTGWAALGAYEGASTTIDSIHSTMMQSPVHREQVLGAYDSVGVGVGVDGDGLRYVSLVFMRQAS